MVNSNDNVETKETDKKAIKSKFRNKIFLSSLIIILIVIGIVGIGFTQKVKDFRKNGPWPFIIDKIVAELNLTDEQKANVNKIKDEIKTKMDSKKKDKPDEMSDFANAFKQDKLDKQTLESISKNQEADREEMKSFFMDELIKFHDVLTTEQRLKVVEKMKEFKDKMHKQKPDSQ
jgi:Spy/CpxP family protein refolding chaperone